MEIVPFKAEHLRELLDAGADPFLSLRATPEKMEQLEKGMNTFTCFNAEGKVIICGGVMPVHEYRGEAWAVIDQKAKEDFVTVFNAARKVLSHCTLKRIEAYIARDFTAGHRWIQLLGFQMEAPLLKFYRPDGTDSSLYVRYN